MVIAGVLLALAVPAAGLAAAAEMARVARLDAAERDDVVPLVAAYVEGMGAR